MGDVLDDAQAIVQCKECPWYKACVLPMRFSEDDLKRQLEASMPGTTMPGAVDPNMRQLLSGMAAAAQNSLLEGCPVFIGRLRSEPKLAERIKKIMQEWFSEQEEQSD
jgi:hypothetical protein